MMIDNTHGSNLVHLSIAKYEYIYSNILYCNLWPVFLAEILVPCP